MSTAIPQIPPRPQRNTQEQAPSASMEVPRVPPRPRKFDRSVSPNHRESFARSPLNENPPQHGNPSKSSLRVGASTPRSAQDLPPRPSSVVLPSLGQEGNEYADITTHGPHATHVADNLEILAPKPSLPVSSAKKRLSTVTRTDSDQAAAFGIGKARSNDGKSGPDDREPSSRSLKEKASFASQASSTTERRPSSVDSDHGIPEIGQRVPMYPNAGDVQAPSPAPFAPIYAPGIGFYNDGSKPKNHARRTSARGEIPVDAYGRFGHGVPHQNDHFEKAYYEKHPELCKKELGQYGEGKPEWAMSSDDLNKIVRNTASRGAGLGASPGAYGTPTEEIGFQATEEYASRMSSPRPQSGYHVAHSNTSGTHIDSSLRKSSFPADGGAQKEIENAVSKGLESSSNAAPESEDTIHVDEPGYRLNKVYSNASRYESTEELNQSGDEERGYSAPILASDEVAKEPWGYELQPAVSPLHERRSGHGYQDDLYRPRSNSDSLSNSRPSSRPGSRPGSIHGTIPGLRIQDSTPLEDLAEYEPLFPEDDKNSSQPKPVTAADRLRQRPELKNRKFPSQDVWEDSPDSLHYTATVSTPQSVDDSDEAKDKATRTETPEQAFARRQEELAEKESVNTESFLHREQKKKSWHHNGDLKDGSRSKSSKRFPGRDVWEDTPDSHLLETTVSAPQSDDTISSPADERPTTGAVVFHHEMAAAGVPLGSDEGRATTGIAATLKPQIPARPSRSKPSESLEKAQPVIPERPDRSRQVPQADSVAPPLPLKTKPQVPARPSKPVARDSSETVPLTTAASNSSAKSATSDHGVAAASKPKPLIPTRPVGSKIAALQGGFMSDLNKRLQLGPQAPKKDEPVTDEPEEIKEKAPLVDARKGRARGPARRAPAKSPAPIADSTPDKSAAVLGFSITSTLWEINPEENVVQIGSSSDEETVKPTVEPQALKSEKPAVGIKTVGDSVQDIPGAFPSESAMTSLDSDQKTKVEVADEPKKAIQVEEDTDEVVPLKSHQKPEIADDDDNADDDDEDDDEEDEEDEIKIESKPTVFSKAALESEHLTVDEEEDMAASTGTLKPTPDHSD